MAWVPFDNHKLRQYGPAANTIDFSASGDTLKVMLATATYVPDQTNHIFKSSVTNEVTGTNYTARGFTLSAKTLSVASHVLTFACGTITWSQNAAGFTNARIAIFYKDTGADGTSALIAFYDFGADKGNVAGDLVLTDPTGFFTV
jgi:hypothetical protein